MRPPSTTTGLSVAPKHRHPIFDLFSALDRDLDRLDCHHCSSGTERIEVITGIGCGLWVEHKPDPRHPWRDLPQQIEPLAGQRTLNIDEAGDVAAGARQAGHEAAADGI